jgi:hypothetical protein
VPFATPAPVTACVFKAFAPTQTSFLFISAPLSDRLGVFIKLFYCSLRSLEAVLTDLADTSAAVSSAPFPAVRATTSVPSFKPLNPSLVPFTAEASVTLIVCVGLHHFLDLGLDGIKVESSRVLHRG